jgi:hypothetical protein
MHMTPTERRVICSLLRSLIECEDADGDIAVARSALRKMKKVDKRGGE